MDSICFGIDYSNTPPQTVYIVWYGGRAYGKTYWSKLWMQCYQPDLLSKHLVRQLAAEAVITISINN